MSELITKKPKSNNYFTSETEQAILEYCATDDIVKRTDLYINHIEPAFSQLVSKIVFTYRFNTLPNIEVLVDECKTWLVTVLSKFNPSKGSKAFSYFSVITKNWFIYRIKQTAKQSKQELQYDNLPKDVENKFMVLEETYICHREKNEFWECLKHEIEMWHTEENIRKEEEVVISSIQEVFKNLDNIDVINRKSMYVFLREISGLQNKQISAALSKIRIRYKDFKKDWDDSNI